MNELYAEHPAMFQNDPLRFVIYVILIAAFGLGILLLLGWYAQTKASKLTLTEDDLLFEQGLLSKERSEVNIESIRTVKIKQTFFNRVFGVGTIEIFTSGDLPEIVAHGLPDPNKIRELINQQQKVKD